MNNQKPAALFSLSDKTESDVYGGQLIGLGYQLIGSSGTAKFLRAIGLQARSVEEVVGDSQRYVFAEALSVHGITIAESKLDAIFAKVGEPILQHRVVTLQKEIHAALAAPFDEESEATLNRLNLPRIGVLWVDFYPLEKQVKEKGLSLETLEGDTDVGGPTMVYETAVKGRQFVIVDRGDWPTVIECLKNKKTSDEASRIKSRLALKARIAVIRYQTVGLVYHSRFAGYPINEVEEFLDSAMKATMEASQDALRTVRAGLAKLGDAVSDFVVGAMGENRK